MFLDTIFQIKQQVITHVRESMQLVPVVKRKPKILRHWLLGAHKPQLFIVSLLFLVPLVIVPMVDFLLSIIFSPVSTKALFGLIDKTVENPHLYNAQIISEWIIWITSVILALYLYLRYLPTTFEQAHKIAQEKEIQADKLIGTNPSESILLYDSAREWTVNEQNELAIKTKLDDLNTQMSQISSKTIVSPSEEPDNDGTVILSATEAGSKKAVIADRYQIDKQIGAGAMGIVYIAEDLRLNRKIALKQLAPQLSADKHLLARFRQEALALARLSHPNIVQVYDFLDWNDLFFIAMELVDGEELEDKLKASDALEIDEITRLTRQMAEALGYAHQQGVIHRDLKPANILITKNGDIKITDFGIAKLAQSSLLTQVNTVMGSPAYMSPEQANGDSTDQRTDIYALGIILYQMICGERPFNGDTKSIIAQHLTKLPPDINEKREDVAPKFNSLIQKMLTKDPDERYQSMEEVIEEL